MKLDDAKAIIAALVKLRESATDEQALSASILYPTWKEGISYTKDTRVLYDRVLYKVLVDHTSQSDWTPCTAHSLFAKVLIPNSDVIPNWEQPDSTNPYMSGDKVQHNGIVWISLIDNNVWEPNESVPTLWSKVSE